MYSVLAMRITIVFALLVLMSVAMMGQGSTPLNGSCQTAGNPSYPNCVAGEVTFTGATVDVSVHVTVTNSSGAIVDDSDYNSQAGTFTFTENFSIPDTYTIAVNGQAVMSVTTTN